MTEGQKNPDWEFTDRDINILKELTKDPHVSSRQLADILKSEYGIEVSHATVNNAIRDMRESDVFRETIMPNEKYFLFSMFEFKFNPENFEDLWRDALEHIRNDKHTLFYWVADGEYQWKTIMMFANRERESKWIHEFYKDYGGLVENIRSSVVTNLLKYRTDPEIFETFKEW